MFLEEVEIWHTVSAEIITETVFINVTQENKKVA